MAFRSTSGRARLSVSSGPTGRAKRPHSDASPGCSARTIWLVNVERADALVMGLLETGRFPINFYRGWVRAALTVIFPVAFVTILPAQALLGRLEWWLAAFAVGLTVALFVLASALCRFALRYYTGASS